MNGEEMGNGLLFSPSGAEGMSDGDIILTITDTPQCPVLSQVVLVYQRATHDSVTLLDTDEETKTEGD